MHTDQTALQTIRYFTRITAVYSFRHGQ